MVPVLRRKGALLQTAKLSVTVNRVFTELDGMGNKEWSPGNLLDVFGDSVARATLILAREQPRTVPELADQLNVSDPTVYRRTDALVESNLLKEHQQIDRNGNRQTAYETILDEVTFKIDDDGYTVDIQVRQDLADDFEALWGDLEQSREKTDVQRQNQTTKSGQPESDI